MDYNVVCYDRNNYPYFRYVCITNTVYAYKYDFNCQKEEVFTFSPLKSPYFFSMEERIKGVYKKQFYIGEKISFLKEERSDQTKELRATLFRKDIKFHNNETFIRIENRDGIIKCEFKVKEKLINDYKKKLNEKY